MSLHGIQDLQGLAPLEHELTKDGYLEQQAGFIQKVVFPLFHSLTCAFKKGFEYSLKTMPLQIIASVIYPVHGVVLTFVVLHAMTLTTLTVAFCLYNLCKKEISQSTFVDLVSKEKAQQQDRLNKLSDPFDNLEIPEIKLNGGVVKTDDSQTINGNLVIDEILSNKESILTFLSHPKSLQHFLEGRKKMKEEMLFIISGLEKLDRQFPLNPEIQACIKKMHHEALSYINPSPYEDIIAPFLVFGIGDTSSITDDKMLEEEQNIKVKIFKNWLSRYKIGLSNNSILDEVIAFSDKSELFSKIIRPILEHHKKEGGDYDSIINLYIDNDTSDYKGVFFHSEDIEDVEKKVSVAESALKDFLKQHGLNEENDRIGHPIFNRYFSRDAIIKLFFEITISK